MSRSAAALEYIPPVSHNAPNEVKEFVAEAMKSEDAEKLRIAAMEVAELFPRTAREMLTRAQEIENVSPLIASPFSMLSKLRWTRFVRTLGTASNEINPGNRIGRFMLTYPQLVEMKLADNLRKEKVGDKFVWTADIKKPLTVETLLKSVPQQYKIFVHVIAAYVKQLDTDDVKAYIGKQAAGKTITLSGVLSLAHAAGIKGALSWLKNEEDRERYPNTTQTFIKATEIF